MKQVEVQFSMADSEISPELRDMAAKALTRKIKKETGMSFKTCLEWVRDNMDTAVAQDIWGEHPGWRVRFSIVYG